MSAPFYSVIIPVFNKGAHIQRSVSSVLKQTFEDFELLLINDASTDNSLEEMQKFSDSRIRILHRDQPGPGGYAARNLGINEARADWVAFLDADDQWFPEHLEKMHLLVRQFPDASVAGCGWEINDPARLHSTYYTDSYYIKNSIAGNHYLSFEDFLRAATASGRPICGSVACIQTKVAQAAGGFPAGKANRGGDVDTWLRCVEYAGGMAWSAHIGAVYHRDATNMVTKTKLFFAAVERQSVRKLLSRYSGNKAKLLKKFSNQRTINAWRQNHNIPGRRNFILFGKLYLSSDTRKVLIYSVLSLFPSQFFFAYERIANSYKTRAKSPTSLWARSVAYRAINPKPFYAGVPIKKKSRILSDSRRATFFGYHDKTPFCGDGSKVLAMSTAAGETRAESECTPLALGYFKKKEEGRFENAFFPFSETTTWCWQQGCMLQWNPKSPDTEVVFNTLVNDGYGSVIFDIKKNEVIKKYNDPIYSIDPTGKLAATLNFSRLGRMRPGYGYGLFPDTTAGDPAPEDDGLFVVDLESGAKRQVVSIKDLAETAGDSGRNHHHYINHATFSPDGKRLVFFHLWAKENQSARRLRACSADPLTGKWREIESQRIFSHYCWRDGRCLLATTRDRSAKWHYCLYDLDAGTRIDLGLPLNSDGHPMFHPVDKNIIVTDTPPDKRRDQHLLIADLASKKVHEIATLYSPFKYCGQVRCDLHPRWDREGKFVVVDSTQKGRRMMTLVNI